MQGFPKSQRLLRHSDFRRVYSEGRRFFAAHMTVFYVPRQDASGAAWRVGYTVGKVFGGAVERNRMKRRLREAVRLSEFESGIAADIVIHPRPSLAARNFSALRDDIEKAFEAIERSLAKEKLAR